MITVTGASGHLGRLAVEALLARGVPAGEVVAVARDPQKAADLAARGVQVRAGDYDRPETLAAALAGADRLLLVSGSEVGRRVPQHRNVVDAAVVAGVRLIAYTSILNADTSTAALADEHKASEALVRAAGLPYSLLRNGWYLENYTEHLESALQLGAIYGSAGDGPINAAARADYAEAAAAVLTGDGHQNTVYELGGDDAFTMSQLAAEVTARTGTPVTYRDLPVEQYRQVLVGAGVPEAFAAILAGVDRSVAEGALATGSRDLHALIGRPSTTLAEAVSGALPSDVGARG
jgi:NAD(P)H dehydrogenase (quinone)